MAPPLWAATPPRLALLRLVLAGAHGGPAPAQRGGSARRDPQVQARAEIRVAGDDEVLGQFLSDLGTVDGLVATLSLQYYGEHLFGRLLYGESLHNRAHCTADDYHLVRAGSRQGKDEEEALNVALVRWGQCDLVKKVRVAQNKGADAVIVVVGKNTSVEVLREVRKQQLADGGWDAEGVKIPSVLVGRREGEALIDAARRGAVSATFTWDIPLVKVVQTDFWMSSSSRESSKFMEHFRDSAKALKYNLQLVPHFRIFSLPAGSDRSHLCADKARRHCADDPDDTSGPVTGADVANEDMRQLCIWHVTASTDPQTATTYSQQFWDYVAGYSRECPFAPAGGRAGGDPSRSFGENCSRRLMDELHIPAEEVLSCVRNRADSYLEAEGVRSISWNAQALLINGWRYNGPLDNGSVLRAICSSYLHPPRECDQLMNPGVDRDSGGQVGLNVVAFMLLAAMIVVATAFYHCRRRATKSTFIELREEVMLEVQSQISDYTQMDDNSPQQARNAIGRPIRF